MNFKHGSLFSGIGGFDLAAEWMGWENALHCEKDEFCNKVLNYYWPDAISYNDIKTTDFTPHANTIDILTGGFPCQPYSVTGKRKGKGDERHLWPEMLRAVKEIRPRWIVGENVSGLINWSNGLAFHEVQTDLEVAGYEVWPYVLPACAVNAPHRRDRVWFIGHAKHDGFYAAKERGNEPQPSITAGANKERQPAGTDSIQSGIITDTYRDGQHWCNGEHEKYTGEGRQYAQCNIKPGLNNEIAANANNIIRGEQQQFGCGEGTRARHEFKGSFTKGDWNSFPTQSPVCTGNDGFPAKLDGITFPKWRNESIKGAGNAIVPQVALQIFKAIEQYEMA